MNSREYREVGFVEDAQLYATITTNFEASNFFDNLIKIKTNGIPREVLINILTIEAIELPYVGINHVTIRLASGQEYLIDITEAEILLSCISRGDYFTKSTLSKYKPQTQPNQ